MISTDYPTMLMAFNETSETVIFNTTVRSLRDTAHYVTFHGRSIKSISEFRFSNRFVTISRAQAISYCNHVQEMNELLKDNKF